MTTPRLHLTADDLDAFHANGLSADARSHLGQCAVCFEMVRADEALVSALGQLAVLSPAEGFADGVMARVTRPDVLPLEAVRWPRRLLASRRSLAGAAAWVVVIGGAMMASVLWSLANRELLSVWGSEVVVALSDLLWSGVRSGASGLAGQPWYHDLQSLVTSPGRLAAVLAGLSVAFGSGVLAFRHLMALPAREVGDGHW